MCSRTRLSYIYNEEALPLIGVGYGSALQCPPTQYASSLYAPAPIYTSLYAPAPVYASSLYAPAPVYTAVAPACYPSQATIIANLIGRSYAHALRYLACHGIPSRVIQIDRYTYVYTLEFNPNRVRLTLHTCIIFPVNYTATDVLNYVNAHPHIATVSSVTFG